MNFNLSGSVDLVTAGEIILDVISQEYSDSLKEASIFKKFPGGSPANIASNVAKQGFNVSMISAVGEDTFGEFLIESLQENKVNTEYIHKDKSNPTSLVFVTKSKGTPAFIAYRCADRFIDINERERELIANCKIFHVSSFALSQNPSRNNLVEAINYAKEKGKLICIDPNFREVMWNGNENGREFMKSVLSLADIIKPSEDDAFHIFGEMSEEDYCKEFIKLGVKLVILTLGSKGAISYDGREFIKFPTVATEVIDTTGAGDAFWSGFYCGILSDYDYKKAIKLGSIFSAYKLKKVGAVVDLPSLQYILNNNLI